MSEPRFNVGDVVQIIDYPHGLDYRKSWLSTVSEIENVIRLGDNVTHDWVYRLKDTEWIWAEKWLQPVSIRSSIDQLL